MKSMVVLFALCAVACGSLVPLAQPPHHPALVLDPHGRPLDTAEVIGARALHLQAKALEGHYAPLAHSVVAPVAHTAVLAPAVVAAPASAVSHQSRVDVVSSPAVVSHAAYAAPVVAHSAYAAPAYAHAAPVYAHAAYGLAGHGHYLKKRSLAHVAYAAPIVAHAPAAVSHQSRVDVVSSPAVVSHAVHAPVVAHAAPVVAHVAPVVSHAAPVVAVAPSAVSHQSRVDVVSSPAVVSHSVIAAPVYSTHSIAAPYYGAQSGYGLSYGHYLKKRSLVHGLYAPVAHVAPAAVSHQSRVDVISKPAIVSEVVSAPVVAHAYAAPAVVAPHFAPLAHSAVWTAPAAHYAHSGLHSAVHQW